MREDDGLGLCGCASDEALDLIIHALGDGADGASPTNEAIRLLADRLGWLEHGVSARVGWLTDKGKAALAAIQSQRAEE